MKRLDSGLLIPNPERMLIRPRIAPRPSVGAGMGGWIEWQLIDRQGRAVRGGEQHNLFLNQGLDHLATTEIGLHHNAFFQGAAVGTDSTAPDPTDAALGNQLDTTTTTVGSAAWTRTSDGVYVFSRTFEFDFEAANGNLTEWGVRSNSGTLLARELFRDLEGNPTTVTKTDAEKLRIAYNFQLSLSPVVLTPGSFTITGIGLINGDYMFRGGSSSSSGSNNQRDLHSFSGIAAGMSFNSAGQFMATSNTDSGVYGDSASPTGSSSASSRPTTQTASTYVAGSFTRTATGFWATDKANTEIATLGVGGASGGPSQAGLGFVFIVDEADRFTKDDEHTLTINDLITVTWGRDE